MSKSDEVDDALRTVMNASTTGAFPEIEFLNAVFNYLQKNTKFFLRPDINKQINTMVLKQMEKAKKKKKQKKKKPETKSTETTSTSTETTKSKSTATTTTGAGPDDADSEQKEQPEFQHTATLKPDEASNENEKKMDVDTNTKKDKDDESDDDKGERPVGNGGTTDKYVWTQTLREVEIKFKIDKKYKGRDLLVVFDTNHLKIQIKGQEPLVDAETDAEIIPDDCTWTLDMDTPNNCKTLFVLLTKRNGMSWWKRVVVGDPEIDTQKIEPENSKLDDLDAETRQTVEKMMFDQRQKQMGRPTSKEMQQQEMLQKFMKQHPEMDFSNVKMAS